MASAAATVPKAPCKKGKYFTLKQFLEDDGAKFKKFEEKDQAWQWLQQGLGGPENCEGAFGNLTKWVAYCKKQNWWGNQGAYWWLAGGLPTITGYAFSFIPAGTWAPVIFTPAAMAAAPLANAYCVNPNTATLNPEGKFEGFKAHGWKCDNKVTDPKTLEIKVEKATQRNDNTVVGAVAGYKKSDQKDAMKKMKFDFAMNKDYTVKQVECNDDGDLVLLCEASAECLAIFKCQEGIVFLNWAQTTYKGARPGVGSLRGKTNEVMNFMKAMHEANIFTFKDEAIVS